MKATYQIAAGLATITAAGWPQLAAAENIFTELWEQTTFNGMLRTDVAYPTTGKKNNYNQQGAPFAEVTVERQAYFPPSLNPASDWDIPIPGQSDTVRRADTVPTERQRLNYLTQRLQGEMDTQFNDNLRFNVRLRALYDPTIYYDYDARDYRGVQGGIHPGGGDRYADTGEPNHYEARSRNGRRINPLEIAGDNYIVDLPTLIVDYKDDNYALRLGNQQIAWGQSIFFRTFDVANGLDYRRHLIIDRAIEEYEDERVPKLALRGTMQLNDATMVDAFVGKFQPDILPNPNTPYNVVPAEFYRPLDNYHTGGYDKKVDLGVRFKSEYGDYGWQAMFTSRYNPLGTFRWAESGTPTRLYGDLGQMVMDAYMAKSPNCGANYNPTTCRLYDSFEEAVAHTPLTVGPGGVYNHLEWFSGAASVRLDQVEMINAAVREFPAMRDLYATEVDSIQEASNLLNTYFMAAGGSIRGNVQRDYHREQIFGIGGSMVTSTENPESFWDSFILNMEVQYTPERVFTRNDLSRDYHRTDEYIATAVAEKWHRWSETLPAAYLVFQYQHRSESDLVGLHLDGYGGNVGNSQPRISDGIPNANYLVFAGFQPTANRKFVFEWAFLYDVQGGLLAQPNVRWNPGSGMSVDLFYNYINAKVHGDGSNTLMRAIDFADEVTLRFTYAL